MAEVGETVDDGNARPLRHLFDDLMGEGANHDALNEALEILADVVNGFAFAEVDFRGRQIQSKAAQLMDANVEADARAQRGLLENEGEGLPLKGFAEQFGIGLDEPREFNEFSNFLRRKIANGKKVVGVHRSVFSSTRVSA